MKKNIHKQICIILTGRAGSGKTTIMFDEIARLCGRYILAVPRRDLIEEHTLRLKALSQDHGTCLSITLIHSDQSAREAVGRRITEALEVSAAKDHIVIVITHAALIELDPALIAGWHVRIDELPEGGIVSGRVALGATWPALERQYALNPGDPPGWSVARPRKEVTPLPLSAITMDAAQDLIGLHRALMNPNRTVHVDVTAWADASLPQRYLRWRSIWSPAELVGCASITLTAASYLGSLVDHAVRQAGTLQVEVREVDAVSPRTGNPQIRIHHYTRHPGSTAWWDTDTGSFCIVQISRHLEAIGFGGYWTCNAAIKSYFVWRFPGAWCLPKQSGSNALRHHRSCAIIYSGKAQISDEPLFDMLGVDRDDVQAAREDEDVYQFALRGAIRNPDYAGNYDIYVYDDRQAERLQARLIEQGYVDVSLVPISEAEIMDVIRPKMRTGTGCATTTAASITHRKEQKRLAERERGRRRRETVRAQCRAAGTLRRPGRPRRD